MQATINKEDTFVTYSKDKKYKISLYCGWNSSGSIHYMPLSILNKIELKQDHKKNAPVGMPLAGTLELNLNLATFSGEFTKLAQWIWDNKSEIALNTYIPNIWVLSEFVGINEVLTDGYAAKFIGVQKTNPDEEYTVSQKQIELKLTLTDITKTVLEQTKLNYDLINMDNAVLDCTMYQFTRAGGGAYAGNPSLQIKGWGYTKFAKLVDIFEYHLYKANMMLCSYLRKNELEVNFVANLFDDYLFFKQNTVTASENLPNTKLFPWELFVISEVYCKDSAHLVGGFHKFINDKYKNLYNLLGALADGLAGRIKVDYNLEYFKVISINLIPACYKSSNNKLLSQSKLQSIKFKRIADNFYNVEIRQNTFNEKDISQIRIDINSNQSGTGYDGFSVIDNKPAKYHNFRFVNDSYSLEAWHVLDASKDSKFVDNMLFYDRIPANNGIFDDFHALRVDSYCGAMINADGLGNANYVYSDVTKKNALDCTDLERFNINIETLQKQSISQLSAKIIKNVVCNEKAVVITATVDSSIVGISDFGTGYDVQLQEVIRTHPYFTNITVGTYGIITSSKLNLDEGTNEVVIFLRADEWAL